MASASSVKQAGAQRRPKRRLRVSPLAVAMVLAVAAGGWWWSRSKPADSLAGNVITDKVKRGDLVESITATGSVTAQTGAQVKIGSQITGRIKRLYADVGSTVQAGQVIAELDLPDIEAQLSQAQANLGVAQTRLQQQESGVGMQQTQTSSAVSQARAELSSAQARLRAAEANASHQSAQTPTEIRRAETAVNAAKAGLSTARSNLAQVKAGANLQVANAQEQLTQAQANARNAASNLKRQEGLLERGFVAQSVVDDAEERSTVTKSQVESAKRNVDLVKDKVAADVQAAQDAVKQAEENVTSAQAGLTAAKAGTFQDKASQAAVQNAKADVNRAQAALKAALGNTTQDEIKQQDVQQARQAVQAAQAQVRYWQAQLAKTSIKSPITGTVLQMAAQQGETLAAGLSAPTLIIVADLNRLQVDAFVDETDIGKVRIGQEATITVDAFPRQKFKGRVTKVASGSTIQQGVVTYNVAISIEDPQRRLKPDMTASVVIRTGEKKNVLVVPAEAVKLGTGGATVSVVKKMPDGKTETVKQNVKPGGSDGVNTEILDGLKEGDTVVLAGGDDGRRRGGGPSSPFGPSTNRGSGGGGGRGGGGR
jgi:HlyD family secretion protein